jgi:DNA-binding transcriptional ArsR family regulator
MVYHSAVLDTTFFALSDPTRRDILSRLARGDHTISDLASKFDMSLPAVSKHVRVLQRAGLATVERQGRVRRATLSAAPMRGALEWIEHYRRFWESELDLLAAYLEAPAAAPPSTPSPPPESQCPTPPPLQRRQASKSVARSARRGSASSTRGRKPRK